MGGDGTFGKWDNRRNLVILIKPPLLACNVPSRSKAGLPWFVLGYAFAGTAVFFPSLHTEPPNSAGNVEFLCTMKVLGTSKPLMVTHLIPSLGFQVHPSQSTTVPCGQFPRVLKREPRGLSPSFPCVFPGFPMPLPPFPCSRQVEFLWHGNDSALDPLWAGTAQIGWFSR